MEKIIYIKAKIPRQARRELIKKSAIQAIRTCAQKAFEGTQEAVPVFSGKMSKIPVSKRGLHPGFLKRSGTITDIDDGSMIRYSAPYASYVERGINVGMGTLVQQVRGYTRYDGTQVNGYLRKMPERYGSLFLKLNVEGQFEHLQEEFDNNIKSNFRDATGL